ncbi:hypothetical protein K3G69_26665 [Phytobacter diazotrophicus]|uniref:hypothetical protein n=1 Tax=Phytobacter diazotrophicus TaxID=395631 RepID=UPI001C99525B|nr:hypothetical protein [Phytobacter diazotrophicus]MBY6260061.1 hypothetical protein [Phytobacter diazotrophicus]
MSKIKELFCDMQEERCIAWIMGNYPDAEEGTEEWDAAAQEYRWMLEAQEEAAYLWFFQESLNDLESRYRHAVRELDELHELIGSSFGGIVCRLGFAHTVTVMEAFLMYSARALLNDPAHLERFYASLSHNPRLNGQLRKCRGAVEQRYQKRKDTAVSLTEDELRLHSAQLCVSQLTFHNLDIMTAYFDAVLKSRHDWPVDDLRDIVRTRQDLIHRNGVNTEDEPVSINQWQLNSAIRAVRAFIDAVALTLRRETGRDERRFQVPSPFMNVTNPDFSKE